MCVKGRKDVKAARQSCVYKRANHLVKTYGHVCRTELRLTAGYAKIPFSIWHFLCKEKSHFKWIDFKLLNGNRLSFQGVQLVGEQRENDERKKKKCSYRFSCYAPTADKRLEACFTLLRVFRNFNFLCVTCSALLCQPP